MKSTTWRVRRSNSNDARILSQFRPDPVQRKQLRRAELICRRLRNLRRSRRVGAVDPGKLARLRRHAEACYQRLMDMNAVPIEALAAHEHFFGPDVP